MAWDFFRGEQRNSVMIRRRMLPNSYSWPGEQLVVGRRDRSMSKGSFYEKSGTYRSFDVLVNLKN